jgi:hypothetical protein
MYLRALQHAVIIVELPDTSMSTAYREKCKTLTEQHIRAPLIDHPHSLELHFPSILREISESAISVRSRSNISGENFDPLWHLPLATKGAAGNEAPLFYYVAALPYHVVYCTNKMNNKEDWTGRDAYWTKVADLVTPTTSRASTAASVTTAVAAAFQRNMGADFILPASHPQLGPSKMHPASLSYLHRASFLKTDFDVSGSPPKDVVVPYFLPEDSAHVATPSYCNSNSNSSDVAGSSASGSSSISSGREQTLLFFAGSDNPQGGFRSLFLRQLQRAVDVHGGESAASSHRNSDRNSDRGSDRSSDRSSDRGSDRDPIVLVRDGIYFSLKPLSRRRTSFSSWWSAASAAPMQRPSPSQGHDNSGNRDVSNGNVGGRDKDRDRDDGSARYDRQMRSSKFCLVLRGDTTSSKRLFSAVAAGCLPVVVSDGLRLPFAAAGIIDYSTFALFFPESIATTTAGMDHMLDTLRTLPATTYNRMRCALLDAGRFLLYRHRIEVSASPPMRWSLFNPVTLTLIEMMLHREQYCRSAVAKFDQGSMCHNLLSRLGNSAKE